MAVSQAFAVAFGLAFLILGGLYVCVRSEQAAQRHRENPAVPQSRVWLLAQRAVTALFVTLSLCGGTFLLVIGRPKFFRAGVATLIYSQALEPTFGLKPAVLRAKWSAFVLAGLLRDWIRVA